MNKFICKDCLTTKQKVFYKGSRSMNIFYWFMFPFGLPYNIWRMISRKIVCAQCGGSNLVKIDSEEGSILLEKYINEINKF